MNKKTKTIMAILSIVITGLTTSTINMEEVLELGEATGVVINEATPKGQANGVTIEDLTAGQKELSDKLDRNFNKLLEVIKNEL